MLNRQNANLELQNIIRLLKHDPDWNPAEETTLFYINTLIEILPYSSAPQVNNDTDENQTQAAPSEIDNIQKRLELLRRITFNLLENESLLDLPRSIFDNAFAIEIALARLFPSNNLLLVDDDNNPYVDEVWEEPIHYVPITRKSDVIIFSRTGAILKKTAEDYYSATSTSGFDDQGNPRDYNNYILSAREIKSINHQGVPLAKRSPTQQRVIVALSENDASYGKFLGALFGKIMIIYMLVYTVALSPLTLLMASVIVGFVAAISTNNNENTARNFIAGMLSVIFTGGILMSFSVLGAAALFGKAMLTASTAVALITFILAVPIPILAPILVLGFTAYSAHVYDEPTSKVLFEGCRDLFWKYPTEMFGQLGKETGVLLQRFSRWITNHVQNLFRGNNNDPVRHQIEVHVNIMPNLESPTPSPPSSPVSQIRSASSNGLISRALNAQGSASTDRSFPRPPEPDDSPEIVRSLNGFLAYEADHSSSPALTESSQFPPRPRSN
jgi:hypothetical protein